MSYFKDIEFLQQQQQKKPKIINQPIKQEKPKKGALQSFKDEFVLQNTITSTLNNALSNNIEDQEEDINYDIGGKIIGTKYEPYADSFIGKVYNDAQFNNISTKIDRELELRENNDPVWGTVGAIAGGVLDPINLIPIGGTAYKTFKTGKTLKGAIRGAEIGAISEAATETILQSQQETRTMEESVINVAGGVVLGGLVGGLAGKFSKTEFEELSQRLEKDLQKSDDDFVPLTMQERETTLEQETIAGGVGTKGLVKSTAFINPVLRTFENSPSLKARKTLPKLVRNNVFLTKNEEGIRTDASAEIAIKKYDAGLGTAIEGAINNYKQYAKQKGVGGGKRFFNIGIDKFYDEVSLAMIRGDKSDIPEVEATARLFRKEVFDPLKEEAIEQGLLPRDVKVETATSYLMRKYNTEKIISQEKDFKNLIRKGAKERLIPQLQGKLRKKEEAIISQVGEINIRIAEIEDKISKTKKAKLQEARKGAKKNFTDDELLNYLKFYKEAKKTLRTVKPKSILQYLRQNGGVYDDRGELANMGITNKTHIGLLRKQAISTNTIKNENGEIQKINKDITLDSATQRLWENGYFPEHIERPEINDLLEAIDDELAGNSRFSEFDMEKVLELEDANNFLQEIDELGIDIDKIIEAEKIGKSGGVEQVDIKTEKTDLITSKITTKTIKKQLSNSIAKHELFKLKAKKQRLEKLFEDQKSKNQILFGKQIDDTKLKDIDSQIAKATDPEELARLQNFRSVIEKGLQDVKSGFAGEEFIDDIVNSVYDKIRGVERKGGASMPYDIAIGVRGPAKERVLTFVTDEELRPFLDTDITRIAKSYTRTLATDVEIKRRFGDVNLETQIREINEEYTELRKKAKTEKELQKLNKQEKEDIKTIETLRDVLRGQYRSSDPDGIFTKGTQAVRTLNYMTKLGGVVFSSIADITRHNTVHGLNRVFGKGLKTLITNVKAVKLSAKDAGLTGQYKENILGQRTAVMADLNNPYNRDSKFSVMMDYFAENFSKLNGLNYWNNYQKGFASMLTQERLITNIRNFDNIKKKERTYMAFLGIDKDNISILQDQIKKHSFDEKGFPIANLEKWGNRDALRLYQNALNMDVERTIVTKGVGDVPLFMNTEVGKTIMQFKSFSLAAHQQVLIAGLQQKDAAAVLGFTSAIAAGMLVYYLKSVAAGREISDDPEVWITEGLDRSGLIPVIMEVNGVMDKVGLGAGSLLTDKPLSRFQSRNLAGTLAGPSFGLVNDAGVILSMISRGEISESDARTIRRNIPLQNITYLRKIFDELEQALITK